MSNKHFGILCLIILVGFAMISESISEKNEQEKYEIIEHGNNIIVFEKETGTYWQKFLPGNEGPSEWTEESPFCD